MLVYSIQIPNNPKKLYPILKSHIHKFLLIYLIILSDANNLNQSPPKALFTSVENSIQNNPQILYPCLKIHVLRINKSIFPQILNNISVQKINKFKIR